MYIFSNITQKENVFRKIKELDCNTLSSNAIFNLIRLEKGS